MAQLTREDVLKLARLARLDLSEDEIAEFTTELAAVLDYVAQLQNVDVEGLESTSQVTGLTNVMREDVLKDYGVSCDDLLRLAPSAQDGQLKVKRMIG
jgi:aspartyl-tRNA(Asn)/glutamyl-tRNA(Gln) amidotransferase subunit C